MKRRSHSRKEPNKEADPQGGISYIYKRRQDKSRWGDHRGVSPHSMLADLAKDSMMVMETVLRVWEKVWMM